MKLLRNCNPNQLQFLHLHLLRNGFMPTYNTWFLHGDDGYSDNESDSNDDEFDMMNEEQCDNMHDLIEESFPQEPNRDADKFYQLLDEAEQPLYPNCEKYSNLAFIVKLMHLKCINGWSDKSCSVLLEFLKDVFPMCEKLPTRYYDAKKNY
ncbi:hypothetical protein ACOSP7_007799 [Xanthoceras sorbifolium]